MSRLPCLPRLPRAKYGGAERVEFALAVHGHRPPSTVRGDCFVAPILAMTSTDCHCERSEAISSFPSSLRA